MSLDENLARLDELFSSLYGEFFYMKRKGIIQMRLKKWNLEYDVVDLQKFGINNYAFDLPSAVSYMCEAANNGFRILGGDIIDIDDRGQYSEGCDNWYSKKAEPLETLQDALNYLSLYCRNTELTTSKWMVAVVLNNVNF